jgi:HAD superfamily hydrolase (TIGR01509 family)
MSLKFAIFDFDMTLIDSIKPLLTSANLLAKEFGLDEVSYDQVYQAEVSVPNCTFEKLWSQLWGRYEPAWYDAYADHMSEAEYEVMELFEGGKETLLSLRGKGVGLGLASNRDTPDKPLIKLGIRDLFTAIVGQLDVERVKPAPDMILKAMELLGAKPEETLYVCDSKGDLIASKAAGVKAMAMTTGGHSSEDLMGLGAYRTGDKLAEVISLFG